MLLVLLLVLLLVVVVLVVLVVGDGGDTLYEYRSGKSGFVVIVWCCACCACCNGCTCCNCDNGCCCCGCRFARARRGRVVMMNVGQRGNKYRRRKRSAAVQKAAGPVYIPTAYPVHGQGGEDGITVICGQASRAFCTTRMAGGEAFFID